MRYLNRDAFRGAGVMQGKPIGVVIHNDAGAMSALDYSSWLDGHNKALGVAHYYGDRFTMLRYVPTTHMAWHTGESKGNEGMLGYEVVESLHKKTTDAEFIANEEAIFKQAAEDMKYYKIPIDTDHVYLHRSLNPTSCPHRSWEIHVPKTGRTITDQYGKVVAENSAKNREILAQYFVSRIKYYAGEGSGKPAKPEAPSKPKEPAKPADVFDIKNYITEVPKFVILNKADYAYKEKALKTKVGGINPKGSVLTVVGIEYAGKYPRFKLKSGLYITTRKTHVSVYSGSPSKPKPSNIGKWVATKGHFTVGLPSLPLTVNATGSGAKIADIAKGQVVSYDALMNDGKYMWIRQPRGSGYGYMATGNVKNGERSDYWGSFSS